MTTTHRPEGAASGGRAREQDRRSVIVEATQASLPLRERVQAAWDELERVTVRSLSGGEQDDVLAALARLEDNLQPGTGTA